MALILVTGVAGFIGSNVARAFGVAGHDVVGCDRMGQGTKWRNLIGSRLKDLILPTALPDWLLSHSAKLECVIHLGAVSDTTTADIDLIVRENIRLSLDLWAWCAAKNIRFIYASSAATYGRGLNGFADLQDTTAISRLIPLNAYGWSKQFVDHRIIADVASGKDCPGQWAGLRLFNVYGRGEDHKAHMRSVITKIIPIVRADGVVKLFKSYEPTFADGEQKRDFVYVGDVVSIIEWLFNTPAVSGLFNVGSGVARSWNDVARIVAHAVGKPSRIEYVEMPPELRQQYQYFTEAPLGKIREAGWVQPTTSLENGVEAYLSLLES